MDREELEARFAESEARFAEGSAQFKALRADLEAVLRALEPIPQMQEDIRTAKADSASTKEIVEAWNAVKTGGRFIKWIGPIIGAIFGAWGAVKLGIGRLLG